MNRKRQRTQLSVQFQLQQKNSPQISFDSQKLLNIKELPESISQKILTIFNENHSSDQNRKYFFNARPKIYINPLSIWAGIWKFVIIMVAYFMMFQISLTLAFGPHFWSQQIAMGSYLAMYIFLLTFLLLDIIVRFNMGYYAFGSGRIVDDWGLIIKKYLQYFFWIDLITFLCLLVPLIHSQFYLNLLQFLPLVFLYLKKFKCQEQIENSLKYNRSLRNIFILTMLGCDIMLIGSFGASIFVGLDLLLWYLQYYGNNPAYYWLSNDSSYSVDLIGGPWVQQYIFAQSFSTGTLSTLAPGPFAKNPIQIFYAIILMTFFMLLASYAGEVLIQVLYSYEQIRIFHEKNIQRFDQFMLLKGVSDRIRKKVESFFQLIWEVEVKINAQLQKQTINKFPISIQQQLYLEMGFCRYTRIFGNFSKRQLIQKQLSMKIISEVADQGTKIFQKNAVVNQQARYVYYLKSGLCKFYQEINQNQSIFALSNIDKTVGQYQFITGISFNYSCKSLDLCIIQKFSFQDFISVLQSLQLIQQFYKLKYELLVEQRVNLISKMCIICQEQHLQSKCPQINIANKIRDEITESGGVIKAKRRKIQRKCIRSNKVIGKVQNQQKIEENPASVFKRFKVLGDLIINISRTEKQIEKLHRFSHYYPTFNL